MRDHVGIFGGLKRPLPDIAAEAADVARGYSGGSIGADDLNTALTYDSSNACARNIVLQWRLLRRQMTLRQRALLSVTAAFLAAVGFMFASALVPDHIYSIVFGALAFCLPSSHHSLRGRTRISSARRVHRCSHAR